MDDYSVLEKLFHRLVLGTDFLGEALYDLEAWRYGEKVPQDVRPVFVCGLARAGTTMLMRALHETGQFASLTYRDMPGVMAPNLWNALSSKAHKTGTMQERAHGDGIEVDFDSPEALDEVFWRVFCGGRYIGATAVTPHSVPTDVLEKFKTYMGLVCLKYGKARYLSKNNNNILRLNALSPVLPEAVFLIPFRDPLAQAHSLLTQHKRFSEGATFQRDYMTWLGHFEFGATHKPFHFERNWHPLHVGPEHVDYWLGMWCHVYESMVQRVQEGAQNLIPLGYEGLCQNEDVWEGVCQKAAIPASTPHRFEMRHTAAYETHDQGLVEKAHAIYAQLEALSLKRLS